jgi:hypothetical protein
MEGQILQLIVLQGGEYAREINPHKPEPWLAKWSLGPLLKQDFEQIHEWEERNKEWREAENKIRTFKIEQI